MAEIPVEKKTEGGLPGWLIPLLLLLLLIPLLWFMMRGCDTAPVAVNDNDNTNLDAVTEMNTTNTVDTMDTTNTVNTANMGNTANSMDTTNSSSAVGTGTNTTMDGDNQADGARLNDINVFGSTADRMTLVDKEVDFKQAKVKRLLSDRVFTVESGGKEMFVLLDKTLDMKVDNKPLRQIKPGEMIKITGNFRRVSDSPEDTMDTGLKEAEYKQMQQNQVYLLARDLPNKL